MRRGFVPAAVQWWWKVWFEWGILVAIMIAMASGILATAFLRVICDQAHLEFLSLGVGAQCGHQALTVYASD